MKLQVIAALVAASQATTFVCEAEVITSENVFSDLSSLALVFDAASPMSWSDDIHPYRADVYKYFNHLDEQNVKIINTLGLPGDTSSIGQMVHDLKDSIKTSLDTTFEEIQDGMSLNDLFLSNQTLKAKILSLHEKIEHLHNHFGYSTFKEYTPYEAPTTD